MTEAVEAFIRKWQNVEGGQERANYAMFLLELCDVLGQPHPDAAGISTELNDYVFERVVKAPARDGAMTNRRIDLYRKDCFLLEAKQSIVAKQDHGQRSLLPDDPVMQGPRGRKGANRSWDVLMMKARTQAEDYVRLLPQGHEPPPFLLICDVGHCIEIYANFRRDGKRYDIFPDRRGYRIYLEDLRDPAVRKLLSTIWSDPFSLNPARHAAKVTRDIATRVARVSKALEQQGHPAEEVAMFLMRVLFTMFAEDVDLLPRDSFQSLLRDCAENPRMFPGMLEELWQAMDKGDFSAALRQRVRRFNGEFFRNRRALPLEKQEIGELAAAAAHDWRDVEPAIFGTFLEQALDPDDRRRLGAHYTPRAYVERLVIATVIDPLREAFGYALSTADRQNREGRSAEAVRTMREFHESLCRMRILDPACGTGNFLYVTLELMKKLESEVLEALTNLGGQEALTGLDSHTVDPHQFLGLEINPRAAAIAELVLWIGHLQWHFRTRGAAPSEPILRAFRNIQCRDAVLTWDGYPLPRVVDGEETWPNARRLDWPEAEFIVGNPPFIGGKDLRGRLQPGYAEALWKAHPQMNDSADFVMYWWDHAAEILRRPGSPLRRFGFVTTNSITQVFQRRVTERHRTADKPLSLVMAIADHPWTKAAPQSAAVRIAMTVACAGSLDGTLMEVASEQGLDTDTPDIQFREHQGRINADLTIGADIGSALPLRSNEALCSRGMALHGAGFIVSRSEAEYLGRGRQPGLEKHIRNYRNGRDLMEHSRGVMAIDLFGLSDLDVRQRFPEVYQHLLKTVKPERDRNNRQAYKDNWWIFGEPRKDLRPALAGLPRYIATVETAKHRVFQFLDVDILPDNKLICVGTAAPFHLGLLSSDIHYRWYVANSAKIGMYEGDAVYVKSRCFDPFPFPAADDAQREAIGAIAEEFDRHRKRVLEAHPHLTMTGLYNVLERLRAGVSPEALEEKERQIFDDGLVLVMKDLHDRLDLAVADAYGWPADLPEQELLTRLVALNRERAEEEKRGFVRWLRPDYQIPRFGSPEEKAVHGQFELLLGDSAPKKVVKPPFPAADRDQTAIVFQILSQSNDPLDAGMIAARFRQGQRIRPTVDAVLTSLFRIGLVAADDGDRFSWRRAA